MTDDLNTRRATAVVEAKQHLAENARDLATLDAKLAMLRKLPVFDPRRDRLAEGEALRAKLVASAAEGRRLLTEMGEDPDA